MEKASELIKVLQQLIDKNGDLYVEVAAVDHDDNSHWNEAMGNLGAFVINHPQFEKIIVIAADM